MTLLGSLRRFAPAVTSVVAGSLVLSLWPAGIARAQPSQPSGAPEPHVASPSSDPAAAASGEPTDDGQRADPAAGSSEPAPANPPAAPGDTVQVNPNGPPVPDSEPPARAEPAQPLALPTGADKSGVTSKAISVPKGAGTVKGMEESFSAQLSTGIATFTIPIALPKARGAAQPSLALSYSSSGGSGIAGVGWEVGVPFIARQTDRGIPRYEDTTDWHPNQDRFVFNGGQELVPICTIDAGAQCAGALEEEEFPLWSIGHQYFRPRVEGSFLRFFWSPDKKTWRVQDKSGVAMELGLPLDGSSYDLALEKNPDKPSEIYKWHLVRQYDTHGNANPSSGSVTPANLVVYRYFHDGGAAYLSDIFDTPPKDNWQGAPLGEYAHHTRIEYAQRSDPTHSYRSGWRITQGLRATRIDVTSKTYDQATSAPRRLVRRYHLSYDPAAHASLLTSVQVEGRCAGTEVDAPAEGPGQTLPDTSCPRLPAMTLDYAHVSPKTTGGVPALADLPGYEGFDETLHTMKLSPPHSVDEEQADLFDINADALPDVLVTAPGTYGPGHGVFFNGKGGSPDAFGSATPMAVLGVLGADAGTISLKNLNVAALDLDGDATADLLHMPKVKTYAVYSSVPSAGGWAWSGRTVTTANDLSPKIDLGKDAHETQVMDVNFDGLVDVVVTTGTEVQTFFALGRFAKGDGQFGAASWTSATSANLSPDPVTSCVPWSATPVRFSDSDVKVADMNGDGIPDIVRVRKGDVRYWPGRGNGFWGTGKRDDCPGGTYGDSRHVTMATAPQFSDIQGDSLRLDDVNGDGLTDLVQVRFDEVDLWLNIDGVGWTDRHVIKNTPASPNYANRVRLVDVNGSGTRDILWGDAGSYKYMDLQGGERPWVLTHIDNGLGKTTTIEYSTSTSEMLAAETAGEPWTRRMPIVTHVVKRVVESDNIPKNVTATSAGDPVQYVTEYSYRDPVFEGRQREFRGFETARARRIGDENSPTDLTETRFLLGECEDETDDAIEDCSPRERWRDNPREALKGLPIVTERWDEQYGRYHSTEVVAYRLRRLYTGLDGRQVRHAFEERKDGYLYDVADFAPSDPSSSTVIATVATVDGVLAPPAPRTAKVTLRSSTGRAQIASTSTVDFFGNRTEAVALGCIAGCPPPADETITTITTPLQVPDDPSKWLWRTGYTAVEGSDYFLGKLRETSTEYSPQGDPTETTLTLDHTVDLDRFHAGSGAIADPPGDASSDGEITVTSAYDTFGNLTRESGVNNRCRDVVHDALYAALPTVESIYRNGCDSQEPLSTGAAYDRGIGQVTTVTDIQGQLTQVEYDAFGRLTKLFRPHPTDTESASPKPALEVAYFLPPDLPATPLGPARHSIIRTRTFHADDFADQSYDAKYIESFGYVDGFGRTLVTLNEADTGAGDDAPWIAMDQVQFDAKGALAKKHLAYFFAGTPNAFPLSPPPPSAFAQQIYDAFGRVIATKDYDTTATLVTDHHALSSDMYDAADLASAVATPASERRDGHGRVVSTIERFRDDTGSTVLERETLTTYLPTGEPQVIQRKLIGTSNQVTRWMRYDSLGRLVLNVEPNTTENFDDDPEASPDVGANGIKAWRYAYNDSGDLVGTSDARGCGVNFAYDGAGRLLYEDYSPCTTDHAIYSEPNLQSKTGIEVLYQYDALPTGSEIPPSFTCTSAFQFGRLVAVYDRASLSVSCFDGRGRAKESAVRVAVPGTPSDDLADRYAPRWYRQEVTYDTADRERALTTGATVSELLGTGNESKIETVYSDRGTVQSVGGSYDTLVASVDRTADGLIEEIVYGDLADTSTAFTYDERRRLTSIITARAPPDEWDDNPPYYTPAPNPDANHLPTFQWVLQDDQILYDIVSNPKQINDWRDPDEWPSTAKPVHKEATYDDLYRVKRVEYTYEDDDEWQSPFAAENSGTALLQDPRRAKPSPHVEYPTRIAWQEYDYDWLGNTSSTDDDQNGFYDRSLGTITNGTTKPYQLVSASNESQTPVAPEGNLATLYDAAGNLTRLNVRRRGNCLPEPNAKCNQRYAYTWDEVGRLVRARRWDVSAGALGNPGDSLPGTTPAADLTYAYDAGDERVIKTAKNGATERHTVYIFPTLELRRAAWVGDSGNPEIFDYDLTELTEVPYLFAHGVRLGRVVYEPPDGSTPIVPTVGTEHAHVFLEIGDHLGSTSVVLDKATGELVERTTYQAYGGGESSYRPERWRAFREDYGFTGKESDIEVGLTYFGMRFYAPSLQRWVSPDPLTVHQVDADLNMYAYVAGRVLVLVDPIGLDGGLARSDSCSGGGKCDSVSNLGRDALNAYRWLQKKIENVLASEESRKRYERGRQLTPVKVAEPVKSMNDGLIANTPSAAVNMWLSFGGAFRALPLVPRGAPVSVLGRAQTMLKAVRDAGATAGFGGAFARGSNVAVARVSMGGKTRVYVGVKVPGGKFGQDIAPFPKEVVAQWAKKNLLREGEELAGVSVTTKHADMGAAPMERRTFGHLTLLSAGFDGATGIGTHSPA